MSAILSKQDLARQALQLASSVRKQCKIGPFNPVTIFDFCEEQNIVVQYVDFSMEGMYVRRSHESAIFISSLRPSGRRAFTCGHELGHHLLGHGTSFDKMSDQCADTPEEFLADSFSGFFLMPVLGIRQAFSQRAWQPATASSAEIFTVACQFGVGYETLVSHLAFSLQAITRKQAEDLKKIKLSKIRQELTGCDFTNPLVVVDAHWSLPTIDLEAGSRVLFPKGTDLDNKYFRQIGESDKGIFCEVISCGITQVFNGSNKTRFARIAKASYVGFNENRFLEEDDDDEF